MAMEKHISIQDKLLSSLSQPGARSDLSSQRLRLEGSIISVDAYVVIFNLEKSVEP